MKNLIIGLVLGSAIGGMYVQYKFAGSIWSNNPKPVETQNQESEYLNVPKVRCYFTSTYGDITREEDLNCAYLDKYYKNQFNTVHVDSLPHGVYK